MNFDIGVNQDPFLQFITKSIDAKKNKEGVVIEEESDGDFLLNFSEKAPEWSAIENWKTFNYQKYVPRKLTRGGIKPLIKS